MPTFCRLRKRGYFAFQAIRVPKLYMLHIIQSYYLMDREGILWSVRRQRHGITLPPFLISSAEGEVFSALSVVTLESATILQQVTGITLLRYTKFIKEATLQNANRLVFFFFPPLWHMKVLWRDGATVSHLARTLAKVAWVFGGKKEGGGGRLRKVTEWEEMCRT